MKQIFLVAFGVAIGFCSTAATIYYYPEATKLYYEGWEAGRVFCKATDETPINQPLPLAESIRRKK